jgi:hypothetical protein
MTPRNIALFASLLVAVPVRAHAAEPPSATPAPTAAAYDDEPAPATTEPATTQPAAVPAPRPVDTHDSAPSTDIDLTAGKRLRTSGIVMLSVGVVGIAVGAGLEHKRRTDVCKEILSADHKDACDRSKMANITLLATGITSAIGGAVLTALGQKRINRARSNMSARIVGFGPQLGRNFAGASLTARF